MNGDYNFTLPFRWKGLGMLTSKGLTSLEVLVCLFVCCNSVSASATSGTSIFEIYSEAIHYDARYLRARSEHGASREMLPQARADLLPAVALEYQKSHTRQDTQSTDALVFQQGLNKFPSESYAITLSQPLFHWDSVIGVSIAKLQERKADVRLHFEKSELITRVLERYLEALAAQDSLELSIAEEKSVEKQFHLAKARYEAQVGRKADYFDARSRYATRQANTTGAVNTFNDTLEGLREISGLPVKNLARLDEFELLHPDPYEVDPWIEMAEKDNLEVLQQQINVEIARQESRKQKFAHAPTLDLQARQYFLDSEGTEFGGGRQVDTWSVEVRVDVPIYQGAGPHHGFVRVP